MQAYVDMANLAKLLNVKPDVNDRPGAPAITVHRTPPPPPPAAAAAAVALNGGGGGGGKSADGHGAGDGLDDGGEKVRQLLQRQEPILEFRDVSFQYDGSSATSGIKSLCVLV